MRLFAVLPALVALAAATPPHRTINRHPLTDVKNSAAHALVQMQADGCDWLGCVSALATLTATCAAAAAEEGVNPIADAACLASVGTNLSSVGACSSCSAPAPTP